MSETLGEWLDREHPKTPSREPIDWEGIKWMATINVAERDDGGMRVWSDQIKGLILSGPDAEKVGAAIMPALKALIEHHRQKS